MSTATVFGQPQIGRIWVPNITVSYPGSGRCQPKHQGIVVASTMRPLWSIDSIKAPEASQLRDGRAWHRKIAEYLRPLIDPSRFVTECVWASVTHNERVDRGASIQHYRVFGTVGQAANGVFTAVAVASATLTKTKTDLSLGAAGSGVTTNEFTTIGLSRAAGTHQNLGSAPGALDGTQASDVYKSFAVTGSGTAYGAGLFDSTTVAGSNLYVEDNFGSSAVLVNGDTLNVTYTNTF